MLDKDTVLEKLITKEYSFIAKRPSVRKHATWCVYSGIANPVQYMAKNHLRLLSCF